MNIESRTVAMAVETRSGGNGRTVGGFAAKFGRQSRPLPGGFVELIDRRFFDRSRDTGFAGVVCRFNHDDSMLLGSVKAASLRLAIVRDGLDYEVDLLPSRDDVWQLTERGDISQSSFAFTAAEDSWSLAEGGQPLRTLVTVGTLHDVAPVTNAAYVDTSVGLRSLADHVHAPIEDVLDYSQRGELRKFLCRTDIDRGRKPLSGYQAKARLLERYDSNGNPIRKAKPLSGAQAKMALLERFTHSGEPLPKTGLSGREAQRILAEKYPEYRD